jgi:CHRD domain
VKRQLTSAIALVAVAVVITASAVVAATQTNRLSAKMDPHQVVPKKPRGHVGLARATLTGTLRSTSSSRWNLAWKITYRHLDHPSIVVSDIHYGKPGHFGPVIVRLCGPCRSGQHGVKKVPGTWVPAIQSGNTFITLITGKNPNGEVRGQIKVG